VQLAPGERTQFHVHQIPSVVVELTRSTILSQEFRAPPAKPRAVAPGETRYAPYDTAPLVHLVANVGSTPFHVMDIELLQPAGPGEPAAAPKEAPGIVLAFSQPRVRVYHVTLGEGERASIPRSAAAHLLIDVSGRLESKGTHGPIREMAPGQYDYSSPRVGISLHNSNPAPAEGVLLELLTAK
jgi:hypothetical protein